MFNALALLVASIPTPPPDNSPKVSVTLEWWQWLAAGLIVFCVFWLLAKLGVLSGHPGGWGGKKDGRR